MTSSQASQIGGFGEKNGHPCTTTVEKGKYKTIPTLHLIRNTATLYKECFKATSKGNTETTSRTSRGQRTREIEEGFIGQNGVSPHQESRSNKEEYWTEKIAKDSVIRMFQI